MPPGQDCLDDAERQQRQPQQAADVPRSILSAAAISVAGAYRASSTSRWYRNARGSAFTSAGAARVGTAASPPSRTGVTTVYRSGHRATFSGIGTVLLVTELMRASAGEAPSRRDSVTGLARAAP